METEDVVVESHAGDALVEGENYTIDGNVITVTYETPCKAAYFDEDGKLVAIDAVKADAADTYTFTAPEGVTEIVLVVKGDATGDGSVNLGDAARIKAVFRHKTELDPVTLFAADVNGDGNVNLGDASNITAVFRKKTVINW